MAPLGRIPRRMAASPPMDAQRAKQTGSFYTTDDVARFLAQWAIRNGSDRVLDPSFGGGAFLRASADRVRDLGGMPATLVAGIELEPDVHRQVADSLRESHEISAANLYAGDFFAYSDVGSFDAVVGNPPFIRYQRFTGEVRARALAAARRRGVSLSELTSSWAPFLVESAARLRAGGRLAMVAPMEICHATYAAPVLDYLRRSFKRIDFLTFDERLFPELSQDTLLLLADGYQCGPGAMYWRHSPNAAALAAARGAVSKARRVDAESIATGRERLIEQFIPSRARTLYRELQSHPHVRRLGEMANAGIGYVTGCNDFFHLSPNEAKRLGLPESVLRKAVCRSRALPGVCFNQADWVAGTATGASAYLFHPPRRENLPKAVEAYVAEGCRRNRHHAYKCRSRDPWFHVPHVHRADAFLTYMSGDFPRLVINEADAVAPNTLHVVRLLPLASTSIHAIAAGWLTSLTRLSCEIEGHAMGGGMLKLEPGEAAGVLVPIGTGSGPEVIQLLDRLTRVADGDAARMAVDRMILRQKLGLSESDCRLLRFGAEALRERRTLRSRAG